MPTSEHRLSQWLAKIIETCDEKTLVLLFDGPSADHLVEDLQAAGYLDAADRLEEALPSRRIPADEQAR